MRAFMAAKTKNTATNKNSDDYVTFGEFRHLLKYLRQYYEYWLAFDRINSDHDRRVTRQEFMNTKKSYTDFLRKFILHLFIIFPGDTFSFKLNLN